MFLKDNTIISTQDNFTLIDPIIPFDVIAWCSDTGMYAIGDGLSHWSELSLHGGISGYPFSSAEPLNNQILYFCGALQEWRFRTWGCIETIDNWASGVYDTQVFASFTMLLETDNDGKSTGRIKYGDGTSTFSELEWGWISRETTSLISGTTVTLPSSPRNGKIYTYIGSGTNWIIQAPSGYYIRYGIQESITHGTISSTNGYDTVSLIYVGSLGGHNTWAVKGSVGILEIDA